MNIVFIIGYTIFCFLVAFAGRNTRIGFVGILIFSIFMTPLVVALLIVLLQPVKKKKKVKKKVKKSKEENASES